MLLLSFCSLVHAQQNDSLFEQLIGQSAQEPIQSEALEKDLLALDAYAVGDLDRAVQLWSDLVRQRADTQFPIEPLLRLMRLAERYAGSAEAIRTLSEEEALVLSPVNERVFKQALLDAATSLGDAELARRTATRLGVISEWDRVVGPFGFSGPMDFDERFPVEKDPWAASYKGWVAEVTPQVAVTAADGFLDFASVLPSESGIAYALVCLDAERAGDTILEVHSSAAVSCWWNGFRVLCRNPYDLDLRSRITIRISVHAGRNWLLVKCLSRSSGWDVRCAVDGFGTWIKKGDPIPNAKIHPDYQSFLQPRLEPPWLQDSIPSVPLLPSAQSEAQRWLAGIYRAATLWGNGDFRIARRLLEHIQRNYPQCALAHRLAGDLLLSWAREQTVSKTRLENAAADCYRTALSIRSDDIMSTVGLALFHLLRNTPDEAIRLLEAVRQQYEMQHPESVLPSSLTYALGTAYGSKNFTLKQERYLLQTAQSSGLASQLALADLIDLWLSQKANSKAAEHMTKKMEKGISLRDNSAYTSLFRAFPNESPERESLLRAAIDFRPNDRSLHLRLGDCLATQRQWEPARACYQKAAALCPSDPKPWDAMATLSQLQLSADEAEAGTFNEVSDFLRQALKRDQSPRYRDRLFCFQAAQGQQSQKPFHLLERYDASLDAVLAEPIPWHKYGLGSSAFLVDTAVARLHHNGTREMLTHQSVKILNQRGIDEWAELALPGDEDSTRVLAARAFTEDGKEMLPGNVTHGTGTRAVSLSGVQVGSIVDLCYVETLASKRTPGANFWSEEFFFGQKEDATYLSRFVVLVPEGMTLHWVSNPESFVPRVEPVSETLTDGEGPLTAYIWERKDIPGIRSEPNSPPLSQLVHSVKVSTCPDYLVAMRRAESFFLGREEPVSDLQTLAENLVTPEMSLVEKTDAVYRYIQENIQATGSANRTVADVLQLSEGSPLERSLLAKAVLEEMGIQSSIQFVFEVGGEFQSPPVPVGDRYGNPLVCVQDASQEFRLLDFSSQYLSPGEVVASSLNGLLLNVDSLGYSLRPASAHQVDSGWIARELEFSFLDLDNTAVAGELVYEGHFRPLMRQMLEDRRVAERLVDQQVARQLHGLVTQQLEPLMTDNQAPRLRFNGTMPSGLILTGGSDTSSSVYEFAPITDLADTSTLVPDATREHPVSFTQWAALRLYQASFTFAGYAEESPLERFVFRHIPEDSVLMTEFGIHVVTYRLKGDVLHVRRSLIIPKQRIPVDKYPRFARFCRLIDEAEKRMVAVERF